MSFSTDMSVNRNGNFQTTDSSAQNEYQTVIALHQIASDRPQSVSITDYEIWPENYKDILPAWSQKTVEKCDIPVGEKVEALMLSYDSKTNQKQRFW